MFNLSSLSFFKPSQRRRDQVVVLDLGGRSTKAVHIQRKGEEYSLINYLLVDAPAAENGGSTGTMGEHIKSVWKQLGAKTRNLSLVLSPSNSMLRLAEVPLMPLGDMRLMLKLNSKNYLQQELPEHVFDCCVVPKTLTGGGKDNEAAVKGSNQRCKVVVGGAKQDLLNELQSSVREAALIPDQVLPNLLGPVNAFELAKPNVFQKESVALVDIGFKNTSITIVSGGEMLMNRVVHMGGDRITHGLAESMGISYAEAEGIKIGMAEEVQAALQSLLSPLGRELRASIDFFEHQQDKTVSQVFISGGAARSECVVEMLQTELMINCQTWNPISFLQLALPPGKMGEVEQIAPQLAVSVGAAMAGF